jgi:hypothetical protein
MHPTKGALLPLFHRPWREALFVLLALSCAAGVMLITDRVYRHGSLAVVGMALCISTVSMQLVAAFWEQRWMWPPRDQFLSFLLGDLLCLPLIALMISRALQHLPSRDYWWQSTGWTIACVIIAILLALAFRMQDQGKYDASRFESPTKLWHDLMVYSSFGFFLLRYAPALLDDNFGSLRWITALIMFATWAYLGVSVDGNRSDRHVAERRPPLTKTAHVRSDWHRGRGGIFALFPRVIPN